MPSTSDRISSVTSGDPARRQVLRKAEGRIFHAQRPEYLGGQRLTERAIAAVQPVPDSSTQPHVTAPEPPDPERVEAAITLALDAALPNLVREITEKVLVALGH